MILTLVRYQSSPKATLGKLYIDGRFECFVLEDAYHEKKIAGETRIPSGVFKLELRNSPHFTPIYKHPMIWLTEVPGFEFILVHRGNTNSDTRGCLLVGVGTYKETLVGSKKAYDNLYPKVAMNINAGKPVYITIIDNDR